MNSISAIHDGQILIRYEDIKLSALRKLSPLRAGMEHWHILKICKRNNVVAVRNLHQHAIIATCKQCTRCPAATRKGSKPDGGNPLFRGSVHESQVRLRADAAAQFLLFFNRRSISSEVSCCSKGRLSVHAVNRCATSPTNAFCCSGLNCWPSETPSLSIT